MPNIQSAKKALRQSERRRVQNLKKKRAFRDAVKNVRKLASKDKYDEAVTLLPKAYKALDKAAKSNIIKKNTASRVKSRLTKLLSKA
jgi:small subunit ribosomal protein S20